MTDDELAAIRAREAAATPGPWVLSGKRADYEEDYVWCVVDQSATNPYHPVAQQLAEGYGIGQVCAAGSEENWPADRAFIAHGRQDIPRLLADHDALVAENTHLRHALVELMGRVSQVQLVWRLGSLDEMAVALRNASDATRAAEQAVGLTRAEGGP